MNLISNYNIFVGHPSRHCLRVHTSDILGGTRYRDCAPIICNVLLHIFVGECAEAKQQLSIAP